MYFNFNIEILSLIFIIFYLLCKKGLRVAYECFKLVYNQNIIQWFSSLVCSV